MIELTEFFISPLHSIIINMFGFVTVTNRSRPYKQYSLLTDLRQ